jgi:hypothetical protein
MEGNYEYTEAFISSHGPLERGKTDNKTPLEIW